MRSGAAAGRDAGFLWPRGKASGCFSVLPVARGAQPAGGGFDRVLVVQDAQLARQRGRGMEGREGLGWGWSGLCSARYQELFCFASDF